MIGMLKGTVWVKESDRIVLDVNGTGYLLFIPSGILADLRQGEERIFYTWLQVREDDLVLFGFNLREEKEIFLQLTGVSGIGPKAALAILSMFKVKQIQSAIVREDVASLTEVPGIGAKTAKRIILELKEKLKDINDADVYESGSSPDMPGEALDTLLVLGFSRNEAREALNKAVLKGANTTESQVKEALRLLATK